MVRAGEVVQMLSERGFGRGVTSRRSPCYSLTLRGGSTSPVALPRCLGPDPPLPVGTYMAKIVWSGAVSLLAPIEVALTLVG
jgi:hypothetical protein